VYILYEGQGQFRPAAKAVGAKSPPAKKFYLEKEGRKKSP